MASEPEPLEVIITADGLIRFVWDDALAPLTLGEPSICRVGDVEPAATGNGWLADLARCGGGLFGPFPLRQTALLVERLAVNTYLRNGQI